MILIWTVSLNEYFREDVQRRDILLIFCSGTLDLLVLTSFYRFIRYATTWRLILCMIIFYGLRAVVQHIWYVEYPDGYDWGFPGFMSLFVPYGETADFFYSGHVGICMINFLEFWAVGWYFMSIYAIFVMFCQIFLMIALRSHYSMDMISGIIFGHYMWILCEKYSYIVDWYIFRIPLEKRMAKDWGFNEEQIKY